MARAPIMKLMHIGKTAWLPSSSRRMPNKMYPWLITAFLLLLTQGCSHTSSSTDAIPALLKHPIAELQGKIPVPLRVPTELPKGVTKASIGATDQKNGYEIDFYQRYENHDWFRGMISGSSHLDDYTFNTRAVRLKNGITAHFRAISCGGSCAPVNLWWQQEGAQYALQVNMPSDTPEKEQESQIVKIANSVVVIK